MDILHKFLCLSIPAPTSIVKENDDVVNFDQYSYLRSICDLSMQSMHAHMHAPAARARAPRPILVIFNGYGCGAARLNIAIAVRASTVLVRGVLESSKFSKASLQLRLRALTTWWIR